VSTTSTESIPKLTQGRQIRAWMYGFLLLGVLVGLLGSLLIAWQYHMGTDGRLIGLHFLAVNAGYVVAVAAAQRLLLKTSIRTIALIACATGFGGLIGLSFLAPPSDALWRLLGLGIIGCAGGALATALFYALEPQFSEAPAAAVNLAGVLFGCGCLVSTLLVGMTYFAGSVRVETALLAVIPLIYFVVYAANKLPAALLSVPHRERERRIRKALQGLRSIAAVLFSLLLFFQFGNEWAIAGWLPLFLIHSLGANPMWAILALAVYFLALLLGRLAARSLLPRVSHRKLLLGSIVTSVAGYLLLSFATVMAEAWIAVTIIGAGFAPIYPLIAERLDDRFSYHPGFYNGVFSIAITGAMFAPWLLGYVDSYLGTRYVMLLPAFGSVAVLILALMIMLEARLMGNRNG
jgi:MFS transporter, FHS family, glucose/mannose:H+ symporter